MSIDSQPSFVLPAPPDPGSPVYPPSSVDYLQDYGIDSVPDADAPSWQNDRNVDYRNIATTIGLRLGSVYDDGDFATTVGLSSSDYDDYYSGTNSTLADNETSTTWMTTMATTTITRSNMSEVILPVGHEKPTMKELEEKILIPEAVIVFIIMLCIFAFGLIRIKFR